MIKYTQEPVIRVGILTAPIIEFELKGEFLFHKEIFHPGKYCVKIDQGKLSCVLISEIGAINMFPDSDIINFVPKHPTSTFVIRNVIIGIGFHWEQKEDQEFEGGLFLQIEKGYIRAINTILLESYLKSVISSEMSAMNDNNLLNAHAIVSRSWLLAQIQNKGKRITNRNHSINTSDIEFNVDNTKTEIIRWYDREDHDIFDVCADDHCQRYQGITKVISLNAEEAIVATRGKVLMYEDKICDARFSKCCGGISEDFANVWEQENVPYLVAVRDIEPKMFMRPARYENEDFITSKPESFCNTDDSEILSQILIDFDRTTTNFYRWHVTYTQRELSELISRKSGIDFGDILNLIPLERGNSGRIIRLKIIGTKHEVIVGKELEIRKWLSESHLLSSAFVVERLFERKDEIPSSFILKGAGWGHGVGMCQIGAAVMSHQGKTPAQILEHYYRGAEIRSIYV